MNKQVCYRIYTENRNLAGIENAVLFYFSGATVYTGWGFYAGNVENCVIIEIVADCVPCFCHYIYCPNHEKLRKFHEQVVRFANAIKKSNEQTSVLITRSEIEAEYV